MVANSSNLNKWQREAMDKEIASNETIKAVQKLITQLQQEIVHIKEIETSNLKIIKDAIPDVVKIVKQGISEEAILVLYSNILIKIKTITIPSYFILDYYFKEHKKFLSPRQFTDIFFFQKYLDIITQAFMERNYLDFRSDLKSSLLKQKIAICKQEIALQNNNLRDQTKRQESITLVKKDVMNILTLTSENGEALKGFENRVQEYQNVLPQLITHSYT